MAGAALALVLGGARSGKSHFAENLVASACARRSGRKTYLATARASWDGVEDPEFRARIEAHRARRGPDWALVEAPMDLAGALRAADGEDAVLLADCLTLWLTNRMLAGDAPEEVDLEPAFTELIAALGALRSRAVLVSNEVGLGLVPETALGRRFRDQQGRLNRLIAGEAGLVVFVAAGLPLALKGDLRDWGAGA